MKKVLIIRFSSIGDIILTTPVLRALKEQLNVEIHFITKEQFKEILIFNPYITKIHTFKKETNEIVPVLNNEKFDLKFSKAELEVIQKYDALRNTTNSEIDDTLPM